MRAFSGHNNQREFQDADLEEELDEDEDSSNDLDSPQMEFVNQK